MRDHFVGALQAGERLLRPEVVFRRDRRHAFLEIIRRPDDFISAVRGEQIGNPAAAPAAA